MFSLLQHGTLPLRRSLFGHFFQKGDIACAYHSLKLKTIYFSAFLLPHLLRINDTSAQDVLLEAPVASQPKLLEMLGILCDAAILVPFGYRELDYLDKIRELIKFGPKTRVMVLHLSDYCNLKCRYCLTMP